MEQKTDKELVKLSLENKDAFLPLMRRYEERLFRYILRISNFSHEEAEDVLQEVFLAIYRNLYNFDEALSFSSWAYRIAHNKTISRYRFKKSRPQTVNIEKSDASKLADNIDLEEDFDKNSNKEKIITTLNQLKDSYKEILVLLYLEERSYQEISDILKKPIGSIATKLKKSKEEFKKHWIKNNFYEKNKH